MQDLNTAVRYHRANQDLARVALGTSFLSKTAYFLLSPFGAEVFILVGDKTRSGMHLKILRLKVLARPGTEHGSRLVDYKLPKW